jgi:dephospho-CoA kinase
MNIIGLVGAPASGKDTISKFFVKYKGFRNFAFADKIKEGFYKESGFSEKEFKEARGTDKELKIRNGLWEYSSKICKLNGNDYFVKLVIEEVLKYNNLSIITYLRTDLELKYLLNIQYNYQIKNMIHLKINIYDHKIFYLKKIFYVKRIFFT